MKRQFYNQSGYILFIKIIGIFFILNLFFAGSLQAEIPEFLIFDQFKSIGITEEDVYVHYDKDDIYLQNGIPSSKILSIFKDRYTVGEKIVNAVDFPRIATTGSFWIAFKLKNATPDAVEIFINHSNAFVDQMDVYSYVESRSAQIYKSGRSKVFDSRGVKIQGYLFPVKVDGESSTYVLIRTNRNIKNIVVSTELVTARYFLENPTWQIGGAMTFVWGIIFFAGFYSLLHSVSLRDKVFFAFSMLCFFSIFTSMAYYDYFSRYVFYDYPKIIYYLTFIFPMLAQISRNYFIANIFRYNVFNRKILNKLNLLFIAIGVFIFTGALFYGRHDYLEFRLVIILTFFATAFQCLFSGYEIVVNKNISAGWVFGGVFPFFVGSVMTIYSFAATYEHPHVEYGLLGLVLELFIYSLLVSNRVSSLRSKAAILEERSRAEKNLFAKVSHDIRTPINGILGMSELLAKTPLNETQKQFNDMIKKSSDNLVHLINQFLDVSKLEAGMLLINNTTHDIRHKYLNIVSSLRPLAENKNLDYYCVFDQSLPLLRSGDLMRMGQVMTNLINNSIKFTSFGSVGIHFIHDIKRDLLRVEIRDTGEGIDKVMQKKLFQDYQQENADVASKYGGTGLGLSICLQLVELMGGKIGVISEVGKGSIFWFTVPLNGSGVFSISACPMPNSVVHLISANKIISQYYVDSLFAVGFNVFAFNSIDEYMESEKNKPDLLVVDNGSMGVQSITACHEMLKKKLPVISLLMVRMKDLPYRDEFTAAGFTDTMSRPLSMHSFFAIVIALFEKFGRRALGKRSVVSSVDRQDLQVKVLNILVADDDDTNLMIIKNVIKSAGHNCTLARNGEEAVNAFSINADRFDLIFTDINMPIKNGEDAAIEIRAIEKNRNQRRVPIYALTGESNEEIEKIIQRCDMDGYLQKPYRIDEIRRIIESFVGS